MTTAGADIDRDADPSVHHRRGHTIVELHGELDLASTAALREQLLRTLHHTANLLVVDLSAVSHCGAPAMAVLVGTQRRARLLDIALRLAAPQPEVAELLRRTGLHRSFAIHPTLSHALAAGGATT